MDKLAEYSKEIGLHSSMTIEELIDSHRHLRTQAVKSNAERLAEFHRMVEVGVKNRLNDSYITIESLRDISVKQLARLIGDD